MRVSLILPTLEVGGQERLAVALAVRLRTLGIDAEVVALVEGGPLAADLRAAEVPCVVLHPNNRVPGYPSALLAHLRQWRPDVLHTHSGSWFPAAIAGRLLGIPVLHVEHGRYPNEPWWTRWADRLAARFTSRIVVVSDLLRHEMQARLGTPSLPELIQNGVHLPPALNEDGRAELRRRLGLDPHIPVVGTVGRLVPVKEHALLLRSMAAVRTRIPDATVVIVGDGPLRSDLELAMAAPALAGGVLLTGARADAAELAAAFDVYVSSSSTEGTPLAVLEAMAAGTAVVATEVGGLGDLLERGSAGVLVPSGDCDALTLAIVNLLSDETRRTALGKAGRSRIERDYSIDACAQRYAALYSDLCDHRRQRGS